MLLISRPNTMGAEMLSSAATVDRSLDVSPALFERVRESVSGRIKRLPAWLHEDILSACAQSAAKELASIAARYKKPVDSLPPALAASALLEANSLAGCVCAMPWHALRSEEDKQRITDAARGETSVSTAISKVFASFELVNAWAPALVREGRSSYIARVREALPTLRFENLVLDASILASEEDRLEFAAEIGVSPFYVWLADATLAQELTVLKTRHVDLSRLGATQGREITPAPPSAAIKKRIASMRQATPTRAAP